MRADEPATAGMLAYTFGVGSHGQTRIATVWTDGSHKRVLTDGGAAYDPAWSPDGSQLAYGTYGGIALMTATGTGQHLVVPDGQHPAWAPDGHRLSYACEDGLCVHDLTTGQRSVVVPATEDWPYVESSSWSPDGSSIAFTRISADGDDYTSDTQVWTVHADGTGLAAVPGTAPQGIDPLWSPDGTSIMYTDYYGGRGRRGQRRRVARPPRRHRPHLGAGPGRVGLRVVVVPGREPGGRLERRPTTTPPWTASGPSGPTAPTVASWSVRGGAPAGGRGSRSRCRVRRVPARDPARGWPTSP